MYKFYRFSPIETEEELQRAILYIATETEILVENIVGVKYPIPYLTVFSHYPKEYEALNKILAQLGKPEPANNGVAVRLAKPIKLADQYIPKIRIREPDPYRPHVGCNDFKVTDYTKFRNKLFSGNKRDNFRVIPRPEYEMIELFHPDYDVLAYVVSEEMK